MTVRRTAIALAAASLGLLPRAAFAQAAGALTPDAPAAEHEAKPRKAHPKKAAKASAKAAAAPATGAAPISGGETEAASLERRRRAFFATEPGAGAPGPAAPSAGVTLGGSGGISPGMGFKF